MATLSANAPVSAASIAQPAARSTASQLVSDASVFG